MKNVERLLHIEKTFKRYGITQKHCVKTLGQGWVIKLVHKGLIDINGGNPAVRGSYPSGLHEALTVVNRLVRKYELLQEIKASKQQASNKQETSK